MNDTPGLHSVPVTHRTVNQLQSNISWVYFDQSGNCLTAGSVIILYSESSAFWSAGERPERLWDNGHQFSIKCGIPVLVYILEITTEISDCLITVHGNTVVGWMRQRKIELNVVGLLLSRRQPIKKMISQLPAEQKAWGLWVGDCPC